MYNNEIELNVYSQFFILQSDIYPSNFNLKNYFFFNLRFYIKKKIKNRIIFKNMTVKIYDL
jgi:hypothetical protein